jgi:hypothetical protein
MPAFRGVDICLSFKQSDVRFLDSLTVVVSFVADYVLCHCQVAANFLCELQALKVPLHRQLNLPRVCAQHLACAHFCESSE